MATAMLVEREPDARAIPVLRRLGREKNRKLRLHAERALEHYREAGWRPDPAEAAKLAADP